MEVTEFFGRHAAAYSRSESHARGDDLGVLLDGLSLSVEDEALDVATGTGFTAFALANRVRRVTGVDITPQMLVEAGRIADERGIENVSFQEGRAEELPFPPESFTVVTCRRAPHHFPDVGTFLREARRVLKSGGRLGISDMAPRHEARHIANHLERLRDASHTCALSDLEWATALAASGFRLTHADVTYEIRSLEGWLYPVALSSAAAGQVRDFLTEADPDLLRLAGATRDAKGNWSFTKRWVILVAERLS